MTAPCLSDAEVRAVAELAKRAERHYGRPQDIEWAIDAEGRVVLLQSRPETVWSNKPHHRWDVVHDRARKLGQHAHQPAGPEEDLRCRRRPLSASRARTTTRHPPVPRAGRSSTPTTCTSARTGGSSRSRASGSPTPSTGRRSSSPSTRSRSSSRSAASGSTTRATTSSRPPTGSTTASTTATSTCRRWACRRSRSPRACRSSSSAPATTSPTGRRCWRTGTSRSAV